MNIALPGVYSHFNLNKQLILLLKTHPEYFNDNINIQCVYGIFPFCIMDGGRTFDKSYYTQLTKEDIEKYRDEYAKLGIPIRLVMTNTELTSNDFLDRFTNIILSICQDENNQVVISNNAFGEYIKSRYPKYKLISSTTKCINDIKALKEELSNKLYYQVCLDYNLNNKLIFLNGLNDVEKQKCEFLINAICPPNCSNRKQHYRQNSLFYMNFGKPYLWEECLITGNTLHNKTCLYKNNLSPQDIIKYEALGFVNFKLEGRSLTDIEVACNYARYLVKPKYQLYFLSQLNLE